MLSFAVAKLKTPFFITLHIHDGNTDGVADDPVIVITVAAEISCVLLKVNVHSQDLRVLPPLRALSVKYIVVPELISAFDTKLKESGVLELDITTTISHCDISVANTTE